jgi:NADH-quinone oxidoreductase subunit E
VVEDSPRLPERTENGPAEPDLGFEIREIRRGFCGERMDSESMMILERAKTEERVDLSKLDPIIEKYRDHEGALIPLLQEAQQIYGYLPEEVLLRIGRALKISLSRIYGVVTFYAQFYLTRRGRHTVRVCRGTACHVRGGKQVRKAVQQALGIEEDETTADYKFTFETVACLGACALAPVLLVDKTYYGKLTPAKVENVLKQYV